MPRRTRWGSGLGNASVGPPHLKPTVAGDGLAGGAGAALSVGVDGVGIEINADALRLKDAGVTAAKLAASVAGDGLSGGAGAALAVNVDGETLELSSDSLRVKAGGIAANHIADGAVTIAKLAASAKARVPINGRVIASFGTLAASQTYYFGSGLYAAAPGNAAPSATSPFDSDEFNVAGVIADLWVHYVTTAAQTSQVLGQLYSKNAAGLVGSQLTWGTGADDTRKTSATRIVIAAGDKIALQIQTGTTSSSLGRIRAWGYTFEPGATS